MAADSLPSVAGRPDLDRPCAGSGEGGRPYPIDSRTIVVRPAKALGAAGATEWFLQRLRRLFDALAGTARLGQIDRVEAAHLNGIHQALSAVHETVGTLTFPRCDQDDVFELIDRVESELGSKHPNVQVMCTFLNSIARSLRAQPEAREACLVIEDAIERAGFPSTWQAGI